MPSMSDPFIVGFQAQLAHQGVPFSWQEGRIHVEEDLWIQPSHPQGLPNRMTVHGSLYIGGSPLTRLPDGLVVHQDLYINNTDMEVLPADLVVGGHLNAAQTRLQHLRDGFTVPHQLNLTKTPLKVLPPGLRVGGHLNLLGTSIRAFPPDMMIGGPILPPEQLSEVHAFIDRWPEGARLDPHASHHHRLHGYALLHPFPDLLRVLRSLYPGNQLHILRDASDAGRVCVVHKYMV